MLLYASVYGIKKEKKNNKYMEKSLKMEKLA